ncbi:hypothetical protein AXF42_Ash013228 [Apostasia shenzhenica]|uniref:Uncharacterized protein n=1 Tax=Apostasia shenzhenica TaxID=1088818 RepID=A0A2I0BBD5_9ASPA|nr:hypothetical protein AXF42_Ash013228 [Apostasia shenzhenica]
MMRRARRGHPPATQLSKEAAAEGKGEEVEVPEPVCGGAVVDVVSSSGMPQTTKRYWMSWVTQGKVNNPCQLSSPRQSLRVVQGLS